jgi:hypothetical protein
MQLQLLLECAAWQACSLQAAAQLPQLLVSQLQQLKTLPCFCCQRRVRVLLPCSMQRRLRVLLASSMQRFVRVLQVVWSRHMWLRVLLASCQQPIPAVSLLQLPQDRLRIALQPCLMQL